MPTTADNPRAIAGNNEAPDYATTVTSTLEKDYGALVSGVSTLLDEARVLPKEINGDEELGPITILIKRMRDTTARIEAFHKKEKEPHLRGGQAVDQFFFNLFAKMCRRGKTEKPGAADILQARVDSYMQAKLEEERRQRAEAQRIADAAARETQRKADEEAQKARDAEAAAARARKPENAEAKREEAAGHAVAALDAQTQATAARQAADDARIDTLAKPSDMVRTRIEGGPLVTMRQVPFVEITDAAKLDAAALWPFVKEEHKLQALKAWAKTTSHKRPMAGAVIEMRDESVIK